MSDRGIGQFPPDVHCAAVIEICTCLGSEHTTKWDEKTGEFKGTRCKLHGGHKFQPAVSESPISLEEWQIHASALAAVDGERIETLEDDRVQLVAMLTGIVETESLGDYSVRVARFAGAATLLAKLKSREDKQNSDE